MGIPPVDQINWWWTCCNSYNPRHTDSHYDASDIGRPHKVGSCPEITEADRTFVMRSRSMPDFSSAAPEPLPQRPPSGPLPPLTPGQLGVKAPPGSRRMRQPS